MMTKKDFIVLADEIRWVRNDDSRHFTPQQIDLLADFLKRANPKFDRAKWMAYISRETQDGR
jgi:hypothetical protein